MSTTAAADQMRVTWQQVTLALGTMTLFFTTVIILTKLGVDATQVMTTCVLLLLSVLAVLGWKNQDKMEQKIDQVKDVSNGRLSEALEQNRRLQEQVTALALQMKPPESK